MKKSVIRLEQLVCPTCKSKIETALQKTSGVKNASVSFNTSKAIVEYDENETNINELQQVVESLGYEVINIK